MNILFSAAMSQRKVYGMRKPPEPGRGKAKPNGVSRGTLLGKELVRYLYM